MYVANWKRNIEMEMKFENQFEKFMALLSRIVKCVLLEWPGDQFCRRRQT